MAGDRPGGPRRRPGSPRARLFLALDLPEDARGRLAAWRDKVLAARDDLRPVPVEALHVTLVFLGYRPEKEIDAVAAAAFEATRALPPALVTPLATVPVPRRAPRLFAIDLADADGRVTAIQAAASDALAAARVYRPERRPFWPHVTIARVKRGHRAAPLADGPPRDPIAAGRLTLYRSLLRPQGARYEPLAAIDLDAANRVRPAL